MRLNVYDITNTLSRKGKWFCLCSRDKINHCSMFTDGFYLSCDINIL